jgi:hypothetical protein
MASKKSHKNFSQEDKDLLLETVKKYALTIENKKTDSNSNKKKQQAWQEILSKFNSQGQMKRSMAQFNAMPKKSAEVV